VAENLSVPLHVVNDDPEHKISGTPNDGDHSRGVSSVVILDGGGGRC